WELQNISTSSSPLESSPTRWAKNLKPSAMKSASLLLAPRLSVRAAALVAKVGAITIAADSARASAPDLRLVSIGLPPGCRAESARPAADSRQRVCRKIQGRVSDNPPTQAARVAEALADLQSKTVVFR